MKTKRKSVPANSAATPWVVSSGYDAVKFTSDNLEAVLITLRRASIEHAVLPSIDLYEPKIVVAAESVDELLSALKSLRPDQGWAYQTLQPTWLYQFLRGSSSTEPARNLTSIGGSKTSISEIVVGRSVNSPTGERLSTGRERVHIQLWQTLSDRVDREDGATHLPKTLHASRTHGAEEITYISPSRWAAIQKEVDHRIDFGYPLLGEVTEPVDVVYTWVDGADPAWRERKQIAARNLDQTDVNPTAMNRSRFVSHDELKYSLRSLEMYANWVRHIYIVTDQQVPEWLDVSHPRVTVVDHRRIFTDPSVLPVFNSHAVESQIHHICGLSEHYIYMNDDVFFARPTSPSLFLLGNGLAKFFLSFKSLDIDDVSSRDFPVMSAAKNGRQFILEQFGHVVTRKLRHTPQVQTKSVLDQLELELPEMFAKISRSKFRHLSDYSIASSLQHYCAYMMGKAIPGEILYDYLDIGDANAAKRLGELSGRALDAFCLNETALDPAQTDHCERLVKSFLASRFPIPSSFELAQPNEGF